MENVRNIGIQEKIIFLANTRIHRKAIAILKVKVKKRRYYLRTALKVYRYKKCNLVEEENIKSTKLLFFRCEIVTLTSNALMIWDVGSSRIRDEE